MRYKIRDHANYEKDSVSKAILNTDKKGLDAYKHQRAKMTKAFDVTTEIEDLKQEVSEIKSLLIQLINK